MNRALIAQSCAPYPSSPVYKTFCVQKIFFKVFISFLTHKSHFQSSNTRCAQTTQRKKAYLLRKLYVTYHASYVLSCAEHDESTQRTIAQNLTDQGRHKLIVFSQYWPCTDSLLRAQFLHNACSMSLRIFTFFPSFSGIRISSMHCKESRQRRLNWEDLWKYYLIVLSGHICANPPYPSSSLAVKFAISFPPLRLRSVLQTNLH